jgi:hypothetical protein
MSKLQLKRWRHLPHISTHEPLPCTYIPHGPAYSKQPKLEVSGHTDRDSKFPKLGASDP